MALDRTKIYIFWGLVKSAGSGCGSLFSGIPEKLHGVLGALKKWAWTFSEKSCFLWATAMFVGGP